MATSGADSPGEYQGRHFSAYPDEVKKLIKEKEYAKAEELLLGLVSATESESDFEGCGVAPWYYERLAILYRCTDRGDDEVQILERFMRQKQAPGAGPSKLKERLRKAKEDMGVAVAPESDIGSATPSEVRESPLPSAADFVTALRSEVERRTGVSIGDRLRNREESGFQTQSVEPISRKSVPTLEIRYYASPSLNRKQQGFFSSWTKSFEHGTVWKVSGDLEDRALVGYLHLYARQAISQAHESPDETAFKLEMLARAYPIVSESVGPWARDSWLLAGDIRGASECLPRKAPSGVRAFDTDRRLTLKYLAGMRLDSLDLLALAPPKVTSIGAGNLDSLAEIAQDLLDAEDQDGIDHLGELVANHGIETNGWPLWNASTQVMMVGEAPYALLSRLDQARALAARVLRAAEDTFRESQDLPRVGQGWIGETQLFNSLREALDTEVVQHGSPAGFGRQHLDVWIPDWRIGVEYQGIQHFRPVDFFGGEEAFRNRVRLDREKADKARRLGINLICVKPGYDLDALVHEIRRHAASRK